ncbi:hypothetical protein [Roseibium aggregatum]|uniref:Uncharacterized protein n=1 Tax=Roseibium aggregatum TaxID=187304 RepID=A0A939EFU6_9HYPH|nr:hypothetical protein [Roseibium aggregatum]MBN9671692.1 hypothetical protein [Roseibium aggregatum]
MARLQKFKGTQSLPGFGSPQVVADTAVGAATVRLGGQIQQSAGQVGRLAQLARKRQQKIEDYEVKYAHQRVEDRLRETVAEARQKARAGGAGLTEDLMGQLDAAETMAAQALPEASRRQFMQEASARRDGYAYRFASIEAADGRKYYETGISAARDRTVTEIRTNPRGVDAASEDLEALVEAAPLPLDVKAGLRRETRLKLAEAWVESRPLDERIEGLSRLTTNAEEAGADASQHFGGAGHDFNNAENETGAADPVTGSLSEFTRFARELPAHTRNRLLDSALRKKASMVLQEEAQFSAAIAENPLTVDPDGIRENGFLEWHQKNRLLDSLNTQVHERERDLAAIAWARSSGPGDPHNAAERDLAERAYRALDGGGTDRDELARTLLRTKGVLPETYVRGLRAGLDSVAPGEVSGAMDRLTALEVLDPDALALSSDGVKLRKDGAAWKILTIGRALSGTDAAAVLAGAREPARRKELENRLAGRGGGDRSEDAGGNEVLERLGIYGGGGAAVS